MGKTLYLIKQTVPDTATDASANADTILNTVLDAMKDLSNGQVENLLTYNPDLSGTHTVTLYEDASKNTQLLRNSDIFIDMFDQQYAILVSEYQKQTSWDGNDPSYNDGLVYHVTNVGYNPSSGNNYRSYTNIDPASAPLYDATFFITTDEVNTAYTKDSRFRVNFDSSDPSGTHQIFKAINSTTYRIDASSGLLVEEVPFNVNTGLSELFIARDPSTDALSIQTGTNVGHQVTVDASFTLSYSWDTDVSYGSFKISQEPEEAGINATQDSTDVSASELYIRDLNGFNALPDTIDTNVIPNLFSDSNTIGAGYTFTITNNGGGGYSFYPSTTSLVSSDNNITIDDDALVNNENYMKLVTSYYDETNTGKGSFVGQYLLWTNGSVTASGEYASNITIGQEAETLNQADSNTNGLVRFFASDETYNNTSSNPQRSSPSDWNGSDLLSVDYASLDTYYKTTQNHYLETRVLLPSTESGVLADNNTYSAELGTDSNGRYIHASNNMVFFKSDSNNTSIDPNNITVTTNGIYDASNIDSSYATIFEIGSEKAFTNQSSLLEAEVVDGSYVEVPGSIVSIVATNVIVANATDYRFKMNPKKIAENSDSSYDFPAISGGFNLVAYDGSTYAANNYLETLKSNMNILGNNIYSIMENNADLNLAIEYTTNGTATNADSLKNYFDLSYSFTVGGNVTTGTHRIEDLDRMTVYDVSSSSVEYPNHGTLVDASYIVGAPVTSMVGWKICQIHETTTFKVRTQLYLGAYSNLYIETPLLKQTDIRYELRTAAGVPKPDYYLKYVNPAYYNVTANRNLQVASSSSSIPVNTVTLSVNDLKSHIGDIQYTTSIADNDIDSSWNTVAGPQDVDPNFDSANIFNNYTSGTSGVYNVYIDVPKTYLLDASQYIIRMQTDPTSTTIVGYKYSHDNTIFTAAISPSDSSYAWDMTTSSLIGGIEIEGLTVTYETDNNNEVTITVFHNGTELFNIGHNGDIVQKIRVIYNPRGIGETISWLDTIRDDSWTYFGTIGTDTILYEADSGLIFQLDTRFRDTSDTSSYWTLTQDVANLERVIDNADYNDLSGQSIDISDNRLYGGSDGAKSVLFNYYRGNADGTLSDIDIVRVRSTLNYRVVTSTQTSINGGYGDVYVGFTATTTPSMLHTNYGIGDIGLHIDNISYSILAGTAATTQYNIYMSFDTYSIDESNPSNTDYHNDTTTVSASAYSLFVFDGANAVISGIVAGTIKSPTTDFFEITRGTTNTFIYYSPEFIGEVDTFPDASWSLLTQGIRDSNHTSSLTHTITDPISYEDMGDGIYFNNAAIFLRRDSENAPSFTGYIVCPPPQLKVTGVVITNSGPKPTYAGTLNSRPTIQRYNKNNVFQTQSHYIDVDQRVLNSVYYPFANYVSNNAYFMNDIELYEYSSQKSIKSYRDLQTYSGEVDIKENKFSIYEYSGLYMSDTSSSSPYDEVESSGNGHILLSSNYLSTLSSSYGSVTMDASYAYYTIGIKQSKYPLNSIPGSRYSYENITFTIGSPFLLETGLEYYAGDASNNPTYADRWVPVNQIGNYALPLDFNVGNSTRLTLYGTNFTYASGTYTLSLKKYSTNFGIDYSNFPRELTSVYLYAKNKQYKQITLTRTELTEALIDGSLSAEDNNAKIIREQLAAVSWSDKEYVTETNFTSGSVRFELVPATSYTYNANDLDVSAELVDAGSREILSILAVTEDEPRNILFMNLNDFSRDYDGSAFGTYLPKTLKSYSGQTIDQAQLNEGTGSTYVIPMREKFGDTDNIYDTYGY